MKYHALPFTVFRTSGRTSVSRISWKVVDTEAGHNERFYLIKTVASSTDEAVARRIVDMMNGVSSAENWKRTADQLSSGCADLQDERDKLRAALAKANENYDVAIKQRDALRAELIEVNGQERNMRLTAARAQTELDTALAELTKAREELQDAIKHRNEAQLQREIAVRERVRWSETAQAECDNLRSELDRAQIERIAIDNVAVSRKIGVSLTDHVARLEIEKSDLVTLETLNERQNEAIGNLRTELAAVREQRDAHVCDSAAEDWKRTASQLSSGCADLQDERDKLRKALEAARIELAVLARRARKPLA
jgi:hypothetical protein